MQPVGVRHAQVHGADPGDVARDGRRVPRGAQGAARGEREARRESLRLRAEELESEDRDDSFVRRRKTLL